MPALHLNVVGLYASTTAASATSGEVPVFVGTALAGVLFLMVGAPAYFGLWRWWARRRVLRMYKVAPLGLWWSGLGFLASGLGAVLPESIAGFVVYPAFVVAGLGLLGMVWLPRPLLPRWYKIEKGIGRRKTVVASTASSGGPYLRGPLDEDVEGDADRRFGAAPALSGTIGGVMLAAPVTAESRGGQSTAGLIDAAFRVEQSEAGGGVVGTEREQGAPASTARLEKLSGAMQQEERKSGRSTL